MDNVMTRQQFENFLESAQLDDKETRAIINRIVINEVLDVREKKQHWEVNGFGPINTTCVQYLRPCPNVAFGLGGWQVLYKNEWFCD